MNDLHCTLFQTNIAWRDPEANRARYAKAFRELPETCDLVVLPEAFLEIATQATDSP